MGAFLLLAFAGCTAMAKGDTPVPDVLGSSRELAEVTLSREGLRLGDIRFDEDTKGPLGLVIAQEPDPGELTVINAEVDIVISGPDLVPLPFVAGKVEDDARNELRTADLRVGRVVREFHDYVPAGAVIAQDPEDALWAPRGSKIDLFVSRGPESASVPPVAGMWDDDAREFVLDLGFKADIERDFGRYAEGIVMEQDPPAGADQKLGEEIKLLVSKGARPIEVPNVRGLEVAEAVSAVRSAGLSVVEERVRLKDFDAAAPVVGQQYPNPGRRVPEGTGVTLVIWED